jgi:hypothetical protein
LWVWKIKENYNMEKIRQSRLLIKEHWEKVLRVKYSLIEKGIDHDGWYSNQRNGEWFPLMGQDMNLYDFKNDKTEVRPKSIGEMV